jgi:hypothetical protein
MAWALTASDLIGESHFIALMILINQKKPPGFTGGLIKRRRSEISFTVDFWYTVYPLVTVMTILHRFLSSAGRREPLSDLAIAPHQSPCTPI